MQCKELIWTYVQCLSGKQLFYGLHKQAKIKIC